MQNMKNSNKCWSNPDISCVLRGSFNLLPSLLHDCFYGDCSSSDKKEEHPQVRLQAIRGLTA